MTTAQVERQHAIEQLIDRHSLAVVLSDIAAICAEKAEHIRANWQDANTAKPWQDIAPRIERVAQRALADSL
jgi:hypothetical protein